jgi:hypothetical protein
MPLTLPQRLWLFANRVVTYGLLNLVDDPALLAMAFC